MNIYKKNSTLFILFLAFFGSATLHAAVMFAPVPTLWKQAEKESDEIIEVVVVEAPSEEKTLIAEKTEALPEITKESEVIPSESPKETAPPIIALAPDIPQNNIGKDAPASNRLNPMTSIAGDIAIPSNVVGRIIKENGKGWGFGMDTEPSGFVRGGSSEGDPNGVAGGEKNGVDNGVPNGKGTEPVSTLNTPPIPNLPENPTSPSTPLKLECISCPKPQFRGKEGTPRVTYDIAPDGKVTNVRLRKSSGDPETDRETLEAMTKWQFNPKTVPEGGRTNVKVRVTFEESGSQFQRENEERRRISEQRSEQQRIADRDRQQREAQIEAQKAKPAPTAVKEPSKEPMPISPKPEPVYVAPVELPRPVPPVYVAPEPIAPPPPQYIAPEPLPASTPADLPPPPNP
jgi:TonB family protein